MRGGWREQAKDGPALYNHGELESNEEGQPGYQNQDSCQSWGLAERVSTPLGVPLYEWTEW